MAEEHAHDFKKLAEAETEEKNIETGATEDQFSEMSTPSGLGAVPKWQWILLAVLILAIIGVLLWYFFKPKTPGPIPQQVAENVALDQVDQILENNSVPENAPVTTSADQVVVIPEIDTDQDGLSDLDELTIWFTNPNLVDTDGDTYSDGEEVFNGYNPLGPGILEKSLGQFSTPQETLNTLARAFNEADLELWISTLSENNPEYQLLLLDGQVNLDFMIGYYENKKVSFVVLTQSDLGESKVEISTNVLLDNVLVENTIFILVKEDEQWKILE